MKNNTKKFLIAVVSCLLLMLILGGCGSERLEREYYDDIHIPLETQQGEIIIKEWTFLLGSGAEIYYKNGGKNILLGQLQGGDDGYCPFKEGLYEVSEDDGIFTIEWCTYDRAREHWSKETFELTTE